MYAQAGGLTHWLVMTFTLWSGAKIEFIGLIDKNEIKIVCKMFPFFRKLVILDIMRSWYEIEEQFLFSLTPKPC